MSNNTNNTQKNPNELGAVWLREGNGKKYYFGKLTLDGKELQFVMFKNDRKEPGSKQPDWRIYRSQPRSDSPAPAAAPSQPSAPRPTRAPVRATRPTRSPAPAQPAPAPAPEAEYQEQEQEAGVPAASPTL